MILFTALSAALASQWREIPSLSASAESARGVVIGTVTAVASETAPYGLSTRYEIRVDETLKGDSALFETLTLPGGRQGGLVQRFSGVPLWEVGDTVLIMLPAEGERPSLSAMFTLREDTLIDPIGRLRAPDEPRTVQHLRDAL